MKLIHKIKNKLRYIITDFASWKHVSWPMRAKILRWLGMDIHETAMIGNSCTLVCVENISLAKDVYINDFVKFMAEGGITIEEGVRISFEVMILTRSHSYEPNVIRRQPNKDVDIHCTIGKGSWIGARCTILPGVSIAEGCVIAAGSVVKKSTEPNGLYAGVPARRIKDLPI